MARNSASISSHNTAALKKLSTRNRTECTGLRARMTPRAAPTSTAAKDQNRMSTSMALPESRVGGLVGRDHCFVAVADREQPVLGHDVLAAILHVVFVDPGFDDGIHRACLFAEAAVDALEQVDVVARRAARAVGCGVGLDRDRKRGADRLAELAGYASFLAVRITPQRVQPAEARGLRGF